MFRLLRFEMGGASAMVWLLIFLSPYLEMRSLIQIDAMKVFAVAFSSISLALPLGNIIHQVTDTIFNPFVARRLFFWPRAAVNELRKEFEGEKVNFKDSTFQGVLVFAKAYKHTFKADNFPDEKWELSTEVVREEISNRYSYYYARLENGAIAPLTGLALSLLIRQLFWPTQFITVQPSFPFVWLAGIAIAIALAILWRIPQLFRELDDIECALLRLQKARRSTVTV